MAEQIIGSIDEDGYLRRTVASILDDVMFNFGLNLTEDDIEGVLKRIQRLDPVGIAARANDQAASLPYGDQRRLEIARALAT